MPKREDMNREIKNKIDDSINTMSRTTYNSSPDVAKAYEDLTKSMDSSVDKLISRSRNKTGNNMSQLYSRWHKDQSSVYNKDIGSSIEDVFGNPQLMEGIMSSYMENRYIREFDMEIDTICKYMPSLIESLEVKKDAVLSSDVFNKDFMSINNLSREEDEEEEGKLSADIKELEKIYKIEDMIENSYMNASLYGEQYVYIISYKAAFETLLNSKKGMYNKSNISTSLIVSESCVREGNKVKSFKSKDSNINIDGLNMNITLSEFSIIPYTLLQSKGFKDYVNEQTNSDGIMEMVMNENHNFYGNDIAYSDKDNITLSNLSQDGLYGHNTTDSSDNINVLGCVVRRLKRENVIPIYIDDVCLGYYYIENTDENVFQHIQNMSDPMSNLDGHSGLSMEHMQRDEMIKRMAEMISDNIDSKFINMNADVSNEIYSILKYNYVYNNKYGADGSDIKITFIPPGDMIHFYFEKDPNTHRGVSDLAKSLFPAKLYSALYITNTLGVLTRSQDKRAYFVKQHVDTNISKLLMNTITQIKKSNFGVREINNLNNIFSITGRFNDYVIPVSQSGDRPIDFEIIPGQDIDENSDLMDRLETMAINPLGVPLELLDVSRSIEFARQITTSNGKFARTVLNRQKVVQDFIGELVTRIYNYHFNANSELESILSPPSYLTISNTSELIASATDMVNSMIEIDVPSDQSDEPWVAEYKKELMKYHLSSYIDWDEMNVMKKRAKVTAMINKEDDED